MGVQPRVLPGGMAYTCDITVKAWPPSQRSRWEAAILAPEFGGEGQVRVGAGLTDLEKPTQHTARSNTPRPSTCKVERETESQMRTWGGSGFPSLVVPATCPVAMVTISGWTARLTGEKTDGQGLVGGSSPQDLSRSRPQPQCLVIHSTRWLIEFRQ